MKGSISDITSAVEIFMNDHRIKTTAHSHRLDELKGGSTNQAANWKKFEKYPGVYCIFSEHGEKLIYVGMSKSDTGNRLFQWLFPKENVPPDKVQKAIQESANVRILSLVLTQEYHYMAPALESFLIDRCEPELNQST